jgi:hypothetical protein
MSKYYMHYSVKSMDPCSMDKEWGKEAKATWVCPSGNHPKPRVTTVDVRVQNKRIDGLLNILFGWGIGLARRSFLMQFGQDRVQRYLGLGKVYGPDGSVFEDWVTFIGKHKVILRGSKQAGYRVCPECGRNIYFAMGKPYLYPEPAEDVELFESHLWGLVFPEPLVESLGIGKPKGVWVERVPVLNEPLDGLPPLVL